MIKQGIFCIMLLGLLSKPSFSADEFALLESERIGSLRIGLSDTEVKKIIRCPLKQGAEQFWAADGVYHQEWRFTGCGITVGMVSEKKNSAQSISYISINRPNTLKTLRGIGIGSPEEEVIKSYRTDWNREESQVSKSFVAGSLYGGLIFGFNKGKVSSIFLGAAAE
ncbi:hypothetical protein [Candidatus Methylobacter oryzae]|uniref:Uncharacterized protein n=1 Tax=Candidatus Methylobacter oryzae TaxID=2497749 RepID=A0ABY3CGW1_9GAMM|nr:hypothetical protein [Candidatus Methylobacter oryzae]TRX02951.1 hypothetical protein EKO24_001305 [Candidatus Methylobacter oryzae]